MYVSYYIQHHYIYIRFRYCPRGNSFFPFLKQFDWNKQKSLIEEVKIICTCIILSYDGNWISTIDLK